MDEKQRLHRLYKNVSTTISINPIKGRLYDERHGQDPVEFKLNKLTRSDRTHEYKRGHEADREQARQQYEQALALAKEAEEVERFNRGRVEYQAVLWEQAKQTQGRHEEQLRQRKENTHKIKFGQYNIQ